MTDLGGPTLGQYHLHEEIGHGGMANVYRATQTSIGREVAVKVLPAHFLQDRTFLERFTREVKVIARLQHPRVLPVVDYGEQDGVPYIVMAYLPDGTLADRITAATVPEAGVGSVTVTIEASEPAETPVITETVQPIAMTLAQWLQENTDIVDGIDASAGVVTIQPEGPLGPLPLPLNPLLASEATRIMQGGPVGVAIDGLLI